MAFWYYLMKESLKCFETFTLIHVFDRGPLTIQANVTLFWHCKCCCMLLCSLNEEVTGTEIKCARKTFRTIIIFLYFTNISRNNSQMKLQVLILEELFKNKKNCSISSKQQIIIIKRQNIVGRKRSQRKSMKVNYISSVRFYQIIHNYATLPWLGGG